MRRFVTALVVIAVAAASHGYTQQISTRATSIGNAVTAVYDHADTLRTNPAGLGFLTQSHGFIGLDSGLSLGAVEVEENGTGDVGETSEAATVEDFDLTARAEFVKKHWGISADQTIGYVDGTTYYSDLGLRAGVGFSIGPIALGANITQTIARTGSYASEPDTVVQEGEFGDMLSAVNESEPESHTGIGLAGMLKLNKLTAGLFIPDAITFGTAERLESEGILDTSHAGVAYRLIDVRSGDDRTSVLRLLVSGDARNVGSSENRSYHLGAEADINFVIFGASARAGYTVAAASSDNSNTVSLGVGADLLLATVNVGMVVPQDLPSDADIGEVARYAIAAGISW